MPSAHRQTASMPTVVHAKPAIPKPHRCVGFAPDLVTGITRPANIPESWALYDFEMHARKCAACHDPYEVHRAGRQLCDIGHELAQKVAHFLYMNKDGQFYSKQEYKLVRVEIESGYSEARGLLRAIERSLRHRRREPFISMDRNYQVGPRLPPRPQPVQPVEVKQAPKSARRYSQPQLPEFPRSAVIDISKRGSLYKADMEEKRRSYPKYNVEVREPTHRELQDHRASAYYRDGGYHR
ncbi:hypothetical protein K490DRAFT_31759 [Saccharata proteae CBS 121410]|uniref:Uncharacterized protein n=1 Tax=Saccharata proteae CBS 121410 TaxID=1314787 RepID=A0A9P4I1K9_9PEZI|nr:hypothetical protein K490DRAFT_31759 [Saccharata proteae CBS 121410]